MDYSAGVGYALGNFNLSLKYVDTDIDDADMDRVIFTVSTTFPWGDMIRFGDPNYSSSQKRPRTEKSGAFFIAPSEWLHPGCLPVRRSARAR